MTDAADRKRRTDEEIKESKQLASQLLDLGVPPAIIAGQLQKRFGICRSSAFRDVAHANAERGEQDGVKARIIGSEMIHASQQILYDMFIDAAVDGDRKEAVKIHRELRESIRSTGGSLYDASRAAEELASQLADDQSHKTE